MLYMQIHNVLWSNIFRFICCGIDKKLSSALNHEDSETAVNYSKQMNYTMRRLKQDPKSFVAKSSLDLQRYISGFAKNFFQKPAERQTSDKNPEKGEES